MKLLQQIIAEKTAKKENIDNNNNKINNIKTINLLFTISVIIS